MEALSQWSPASDFRFGRAGIMLTGCQNKEIFKKCLTTILNRFNVLACFGLRWFANFSWLFES
jgi:hypothetical protein